MIQVRDLMLARGQRALLREINLTLMEGDFVALVGPSGAGKSTLMRTLLGLMKPTAGQVELGGQPLQRMSEQQRAGWMSWMPQRLIVDDHLSATELVAAARFRFAETRAEADRHAMQALAQVDVVHLAAQSVNTLSGGELQRVMLAACLAQSSRYLMVDEPSAHLDPVLQAAMYRLLGQQWRAGKGCLCITHDPNLLQRLGPPETWNRIRIAGMREGRIAFLSHYAAADLGEHLAELFGVHWHRLPHASGHWLIPADA